MVLECRFDSTVDVSIAQHDPGRFASQALVCTYTFQNPTSANAQRLSRQCYNKVLPNMLSCVLSLPSSGNLSGMSVVRCLATDLGLLSLAEMRSSFDTKRL